MWGMREIYQQIANMLRKAVSLRVLPWRLRDRKYGPDTEMLVCEDLIFVTKPAGALAGLDRHVLVTCLDRKKYFQNGRTKVRHMIERYRKRGAQEH